MYKRKKWQLDEQDDALSQKESQDIDDIYVNASIDRAAQKKGKVGRPAGSQNLRNREIYNKATLEGLTPLEYLLSIMRDETKDEELRILCAVRAAPFVHPKLANMEIKASVEHSNVIELSDSELAKIISKGEVELIDYKQ